jgi:hypothetical protein
MNENTIGANTIILISFVILSIEIRKRASDIVYHYHNYQNEYILSN